MTIRTSGIIPGFTGATYTQMKSQFSDLQRQLGTGLKAETYGGLGDSRGLALGLRGSLSQLSAWQQSITTVTTRISIMDKALDNVQKTVTSAKKSLVADDFTLSSGLTIGQQTAKTGLEAVIDLLNSSDGTRYLFAGRSTQTEPVLDRETIMSGEGVKAGFQQVMRERMQADLGSASANPELDGAATGRVTLSASGTVPVTVTEDGVHPFGLKIDSVSGSVGGVSASTTAGPPASATLAAGTGTAEVGQNLSIAFKLPDGSTERVTLTAVAADADTLQPGQFRVGATSTETLQNMREALGGEMSKLVSTKLAAASAVKAGDDFFKGETDPAALAGPPAVDAGVAKRLVPGASGTMADAVAYDTPANAEASTVRWYQGDQTSTDARATAAGQVDRSVTVAYGARADEEALRSVVQNLAVASAVSFRTDDSQARERYQALQTRLASGLSGEGAGQTVDSIRVELSVANSSAAAAKTRHTDTSTLLSNMQADVEQASPESVAMQILALQTQLSASYQTSSMLSKLSLVSYL